MLDLELETIREYIRTSRMGFWKLELENDVPVRMYADAAMQEMMGVRPETTPEQCCAFFTEHIHPDDIPLTAAYIEEMLRGDAEIVYRYLHPTRGEVRVRCGGRRLKREGDMVILAGYHREYTDVFHLEDKNQSEQWLVKRNRDLQQEQSSAAEYNRSITDRAACGIVYYTLPDWNNLYTNAEALRVFGVEDLENANRNLPDLMRNIRYRNPGDLQKLRALRTMDGSVDYECVITGENGVASTVMAHTEVITTSRGERCVYSTFLDISENESLKSEKSVLDTLCQDYQSFSYLDFEKEIITMTKSTAEARRPLKDGLVTAGFDIYRENLRAYFANAVEQESAPDFLQVLDPDHLKTYLRQHGKLTYRFCFRGTTGERHYLEVFSAITGENGGGAVVGFRLIDDIIAEEEKKKTELRKMNAQLEQQREMLTRALAEADRANAAKTSFLSRMSHDIRTPLNGIIGLLEIDAAHPEDRALMDSNRKKMQIAADHLLSLINDVLQMSKIEDGTVPLTREVIDFPDLSRDIVAMLEQLAVENGIRLEFKPEKDQYPCVYGSPLHLRQIFLNIYGNCVKFNRPGGKIFTTVDCWLDDSGHCTYEWVISDTGIGMSKAFLKRIFEPFVQENNDARSEYRGTGLGMSIVKGLVEKMGGTIIVDSEQGVGSTFTLRIPFEIAQPVKKLSAQKQGPCGTIRGLKLLLAEDNELNAEIAKILLEDAGAKVTLAQNGRQAVEAFRSSPSGTFDAIVMDIMMPVMNGYEATRAVRSLDRSDAKTIPIIAMTANAFAEDAEKCLKAGMNAHLAKPLKMDKVVETICRQTRPCQNKICD